MKPLFSDQLSTLLLSLEIAFSSLMNNGSLFEYNQAAHHFQSSLFKLQSTKCSIEINLVDSKENTTLLMRNSERKERISKSDERVE